MYDCYVFNYKGLFKKAGSLLEVASYFEIEITDEGKVFFEGKRQARTYSMKSKNKTDLENSNSFSKEEAHMDFVRTGLNNIIDLVKGRTL
jgi:hypothetical protein